VLRGAGVKISMDGKGRCLDNVFVERLWRSLKYEEVYLHAYDSVHEARAGIGRYLKRNAGDVCGPDLVGPRDFQAPQQVRVRRVSSGGPTCVPRCSLARGRPQARPWP
jgi:transposase InsO family protein